MHFETFSLFAIVASVLGFAVVAVVVNRNDKQRTRYARHKRDALRRAQRRAIFSAYGVRE